MKGVLEKAIQNRIIKTILAAAIVFILTYAIAAEMSISSVSYLGGGEADVTAPASINKVSWSIKTQPMETPGRRRWLTM
ncbi:MAG: hypothetical protein RMJ15_08300 [Nitrososphaerota archaeon]|nr:hypothetical protein [Nitrososphaerota archaeon]